MKDRPMNSETISYAVGAVAFFGVILLIYSVYRSHRSRIELLITELLNQYFEGKISLDQLADHRRIIASRHFTQSAEFYSLAIDAFQRAVDAKIVDESLSKEDETKLLRSLAALKNEFGLTDLYKVEKQRPGHV